MSYSSNRMKVPTLVSKQFSDHSCDVSSITSSSCRTECPTSRSILSPSFHENGQKESTTSARAISTIPDQDSQLAVSQSYANEAIEKLGQNIEAKFDRSQSHILHKRWTRTRPRRWIESDSDLYLIVDNIVGYCIAAQEVSEKNKSYCLGAKTETSLAREHIEYSSAMIYLYEVYRLQVTAQFLQRHVESLMDKTN